MRIRENVLNTIKKDKKIKQFILNYYSISDRMLFNWIKRNDIKLHAWDILYYIATQYDLNIIDLLTEGFPYLKKHCI